MGTPDSVLGEYAEPGTESASCLLSAAPVFRRHLVNRLGNRLLPPSSLKIRLYCRGKIP
jgi:hypothetical protein